MNTIIVSAFPACGKTYFHRLYPKNTLDSDSSLFSWIINEFGEKARNPNFPNNYIQRIKENMGKYVFIFVSSHEEVRNMLKENNLDYILVYPEKTLKQEWIERCIKRNNEDTFVTFMKTNYEMFIDNLEKETFPTKVTLKQNQYLSDILKQNQFEGLLYIE